MKALICIDDTDNHNTVGTGELALEFSKKIVKNCWGSTDAISRHQLFVHPDIPYTSHNSSMCFGVELIDGCLEKIIDYGQKFLLKKSAAGSDPGLCVAVVDRIKNPQQLIDYGKKAKETVLTKQEAYTTAKEIGIHLSEHGGTGGGVIGALAGIGLRLSGNDGRFKGKYFVGREAEVLTVQEIISQTNIQEVREQNGKPLEGSDEVEIGKKVKSVLLDGKIILLVEPEYDTHGNKTSWLTLHREKIQKY